MRRIIFSGLTLLILDTIFLLFVSPMFNTQIIAVQGSPIKLNLVGTFLSYVFLIFGLNYFIIQQQRPVLDALLLGLVIYGTYETTTLALLRNWQYKTAIIDTLWGGVLFALTTAIVYRFS